MSVCVIESEKESEFLFNFSVDYLKIYFIRSHLLRLQLSELR